MIWFVATVAGAVALSGCVSPPAQLANVGEAKIQARAYEQSGQYQRDLAVIAGEASSYLLSHLEHVSKPAIVLDIDETALSNWPQIAVNDFAYFPTLPCAEGELRAPCGSEGWEQQGRAPAIRPTLELFKLARTNQVAVFFITGRSETKRAATEKNLRDAGYQDWAGLVLKPVGMKVRSAADYKASERARIAAQGYTIILNMGDQQSDLDGGYAQKTFLLPNPFYAIH